MRWSSYSKNDSQVLLDGDSSFQGLNMLLNRDLLPPGMLARSENKRLRLGSADKRPGTTFVSDFNPAFANDIIGSHVYSNPNGEEVLLVATKSTNYIWMLQYGKDPVQIDLASGTTGTGFVEFCQAFDKVFMFRVPVVKTMFWTGNVTDDFEDVVLVPPGQNLIPNTYIGVPFMDRILLYNAYSSDTLYKTDVNLYSSYDPALGVLRVNSGESDVITAILPYFKESFLVFMKHSVHMVADFNVDTLGAASQRRLTSKVGNQGIFMPLMVGSDVQFLSQPGGFYRISESIQDQIAVDPIPFSEAIKPIIKLIDWGRATLFSCSASLDDYSYFTLATLGKTGAADTIVVYNNVNRQWESIDTFDDPDFRINRLHVTLFNGAPRLFALDYAARQVYLLYDGFDDEINGVSRPVRDKIETRGYVCGDPAAFKRYQTGSIGLRTYDPEAVVTTITDGFNEERHAIDVDKDRTKFYQHGHADFDLLTDDPNEPKREDYSIESEDNFCIEDFEGLTDGPIYFMPASSFVFDGVKQESLEPVPIWRNGRWVSLRIESDSGVCDVMGTSVEAIIINRSQKTLA